MAPTRHDRRRWLLQSTALGTSTALTVLTGRHAAAQATPGLLPTTPPQEPNMFAYVGSRTTRERNANACALV